MRTRSCGVWVRDGLTICPDLWLCIPVHFRPHKDDGGSAPKYITVSDGDDDEGAGCCDPAPSVVWDLNEPRADPGVFNVPKPLPLGTVPETLQFDWKSLGPKLSKKDHNAMAAAVERDTFPDPGHPPPAPFKTHASAMMRTIIDNYNKDELVK